LAYHNTSRFTANPQDVAAWFDRVIPGPKKPGANGEVTCRCPLPTHGSPDDSPSFTYNPEKGTWYCHAEKTGGGIKDLARLLNVEPPWISGNERGSKGGRIVAVYSYTDADGTLLYQVVRKDPKAFVQRRPDPDKPGEWLWNTKGVTAVPYRLPELLAALQRGETVYIAEGEKDVNNLAALGLTATCNHGGAGKWTKAHSKWFPAGAEVVVFPDNDDPGREHAQKVADQLIKHGCRVRIVELPGLPDKGDVSDWLAAGHTKDELLALADQAPYWEPTAEPEPECDTASTEAAHLTDLGNARRLIARYGENLRYCWPWSRWLIWNGKSWHQDDTAEVVRYAKDTVRSIYIEAANCADQNRRTALAEWARRSEGESRINAMINLARSEPGIPVLPSQLDSDPMLFPVQNGVIDLRQKTFIPEHRKSDLITRLVPITFDPRAECPLWDSFLDRIMAGNRDMIEFLQRCVGYSLTGDVSEHVLLILYGRGANGKTVFLNTLLALTGPYGKQAAPDLLLAKKYETHPTELADLMGVRTLVSSETAEGRRLSEALIKQLTGGDKIKARFLYSDFFEFSPTHTIWLATNHKPIVRGTDHGIWRRIRLIPFTVTIPEDEQDKHLSEKLLSELPGILNWAVKGCLMWQQDGLDAPDEVKTATSNYRAEMDVLQAFINEECIVNPLAKVRSSHLYKAYLEWCKTTNEHELSQRQFTNAMQERGFTKTRTESGVWFMGIGLNLDEGQRRSAGRYS